MGIAVKVLTPFFGPPQGIVIGRGDRPEALNAAFLNAVSANVLEYDDTHLGTVMHPAAPVAPGLFGSTFEATDTRSARSSPAGLLRIICASNPDNSAFTSSDQSSGGRFGEI